MTPSHKLLIVYTILFSNGSLKRCVQLPALLCHVCQIARKSAEILYLKGRKACERRQGKTIIHRIKMSKGLRILIMIYRRQLQTLNCQQHLRASRSIETPIRTRRSRPSELYPPFPCPIQVSTLVGEAACGVWDDCRFEPQPRLRPYPRRSCPPLV